MSRRETTTRTSHRDSRGAQAAEEHGGADDPKRRFPEREDSSPAGRQLLKTAAIYARVSTDKQEKEETIQSQLDAVRRAVEERGYEAPPELIFVDDGYTGARMERPGLERLRDLASEGAFEAVLVYSPDRLAREYAYQVVVVDELKRAGCEVVFLNHDFGKTPEERMLLQIQGVFAEYERALIKERTRRGRLFAARQGRVNWGTAPYGYRYVRKTDTTPQQIVIDEKEAEVVREMYRWLIEEQMTSCAIQKRLQERSVPSRKRSIRGWGQSSVISVLRNPFYKGEAYYNRRTHVDAVRPNGERGFKDLRPGNGRSLALRPREEWIPVRVPVILDPETWQLAQEQLTRNRERARRNNTKHAYLLKSLLVCGRCSRRMVGNWTHNGGYYLCPNARPQSAPWACGGRCLNVPKIEAAIWEQVKALLSKPEVLKTHYQEGRGDPAVNVREEQEHQRIERKLAALSREKQRLIDAYQAEILELAELKERRARLDEHGRMLQQRLDEVDRQRTDREREVRLLEGLETFCESVQGTLAEELSFEMKQKVLRLIIDRIVVEDSKVVIHHVVPTGPIRLQPEHLAVKRNGR